MSESNQIQNKEAGNEPVMLPSKIITIAEVSEHFSVADDPSPKNKITETKMHITNLAQGKSPGKEKPSENINSPGERKPSEIINSSNIESDKDSLDGINININMNQSKTSEPSFNIHKSSIVVQKKDGIENFNRNMPLNRKKTLNSRFAIQGNNADNKFIDQDSVKQATQEKSHFANGEIELSKQDDLNQVPKPGVDPNESYEINSSGVNKPRHHFNISENNRKNQDDKQAAKHKALVSKRLQQVKGIQNQNSYQTPVNSSGVGTKQKGFEDCMDSLIKDEHNDLLEKNKTTLDVKTPKNVNDTGLQQIQSKDPVEGSGIIEKAPANRTNNTALTTNLKKSTTLYGTNKPLLKHFEKPLQRAIEHSKKVHQGSTYEDFNSYYELWGEVLLCGSQFTEKTLRFATDSSLWCYETELIYETIEDFSSGEITITKKLVDISTKGSGLAGNFTHVSFTKDNMFVIDKAFKFAAMVNHNASCLIPISEIYNSFDQSNVDDIMGFEAYNDQLIYYCDSYSVHILVTDQNTNRIDQSYIPKKNSEQYGKRKDSLNYMGNFEGGENEGDENDIPNSNQSRTELPEKNWKHHVVAKVFDPLNEDMYFIDLMCLHFNASIGGGLFLYLRIIDDVILDDDAENDNDILQSNQLLVYYKGIDKYLNLAGMDNFSESELEQGNMELFFEDYFNGIAQIKSVNDYLLIRTIHNKLRVFDIMTKTLVYKLENESGTIFVNINLFIQNCQGQSTIEERNKKEEQNDLESHNSNKNDMDTITNSDMNAERNPNQKNNQNGIKKQLVLSDTAGSITRIDIDTGIVVGQDTKFNFSENNRMQCLNYSTDPAVSNYIFTLSKDASIGIHDLANLERIYQSKNIFQHRGRIYSIKSSPDSEYLYTSDSKGYLKKFSFKFDLLIKDFGKIHQGGILCMVFTRDYEYFFTADSRGSMKQWSAKDEILVKDYPKIHDGSIWSIAATADSKYIFTSSSYGFVKQFDIKNKTIVRDIGQVVTGNIYSITCTADSDSLFVSTEFGDVKQFEVRSGQLVRHLTKIHFGEILSICCSEDSKYLFTSDHRGEIKYFTIADGMMVSDWKKWHKNGEILAMECSEDNKYLVTCDNAGYVYQNNINPQSQLLDYGQVHHDKVRSINLTRDSKYLVTSDQSGIIKKFYIKQGNLFRDMDISDGGYTIGNVENAKNDQKLGITCFCLGPNYTFPNFLTKGEDIRMSDYLIIADDKGTLKKFNKKTGMFETTFSYLFPNPEQKMNTLIANTGMLIVSKIPEIIENHDQLEAEQKEKGHHLGNLFHRHRDHDEKVEDPDKQDQAEIQEEKVAINKTTLVPDSPVKKKISVLPGLNIKNIKTAMGRLALKDTQNVKLIIEKRKEQLGIKGCDYRLSKENVHGLYVMSISMYNQNMFLTNNEGQLIEICINKKRLIKDYGIIHSGEIDITVISPDEKYLFAAGATSIYQVDIQQKILVYTFHEQHEGEIKACAITKNSKYLFTADWNGDVKQIDIAKRSIVKYYRKCHSAWINSIVVTSDSHNLFTSCFNGYLKQFSIPLRKLNDNQMKDYGKVLEGEIHAMCVSLNDMYLFLGDSNGHIIQFDIKDQRLIRDYGAVHDNQIKQMVPNHSGTSIFTLDSKNNIKKFSQDRFINDKNHRDFWMPQDNFYVPYAVRYYNFKREMNYQSSNQLKHIESDISSIGNKSDTYQHNYTQEFLNINHQALNREYMECSKVSKLDVLVTLYAQAYYELETFIPQFLHSLMNNKNAPKLRINKLFKYLENCIDDHNKMKIMQFCHHYQFTHIPCIEKGSKRLKDAHVIKTNQTYKYPNTEILDKKGFFAPEHGTPPFDLLVYKFNYPINQKNPGKKFYNYLENMKSLDNKSLKDPYLNKLIDYIWGYYQKFLIYYLLYTTVPLLFVMLKGFFMDDDDVHNIGGVRLVTIFNYCAIGTAMVYMPVHELLQMISGGSSYFNQTNLPDALCIQSYIANFVIWFIVDKSTTWTVSIQCIAIAFGFLKLWIDQNYINFIRAFNKNLIRVLNSIGAFFIIIILFLLCFGEIFYTSKFYLDNDYGNSYFDYIMVTYDIFFGNWGPGTFEDPKLQWIYVIFLIFTVLFPILVFNILIAIVDDAYHKNDETLESDDCKDKITFILEVIEIRSILYKFLLKCCTKKDSADRKGLEKKLQGEFLYIVMDHRELEEMPVDFDEWKDGIALRLENIEKKTDKIEMLDRFEVQLSNTDAKITQLLRKLGDLSQKFNEK